RRICIGGLRRGRCCRVEPCGLSVWRRGEDVRRWGRRWAGGAALVGRAGAAEGAERQGGGGGRGRRRRSRGRGRGGRGGRRGGGRGGAWKSWRCGVAAGRRGLFVGPPEARWAGRRIAVAPGSWMAEVELVGTRRYRVALSPSVAGPARLVEVPWLGEGAGRWD